MGGNASAGKEYEGADFISNMRAYDQLPYYVRRALADADHNYAARQILRDFQSRKLPRHLAVSMIQQNDRLLHNELAARGLILGGQR